MRLFSRPLPSPKTVEENQRGINMVDLMMWLVIAALLLAAAIQSIGYYQQASLTYQAKSDLSGEHSWAAARTSLDTKAPTVTELTAALTSGDLKLTNNGGVYNIGIIATTGNKYCLGVKSPNVKGNNVFYSTSDDPNKVMSDVALPAFCGTATEVTTTGTTTVETPSGTSTSTASPSATPTASSTSTATPTGTATATPTSTGTATPTPTPTPPPTFTTINWTSMTETTTTNIYKGSGSPDLSVLLAGGNSGSSSSYLSTNGGTSWAKSVAASTRSIHAVAVSANGRTMLAGENDGSGYGAVYLSTDGGTNWAKTSTGNGYWESVSISADGTTMIAGDAGPYPATWVSTNSGVTWTKTTIGAAVYSSAMSADGKTIYVAGNSWLVVSTDSGATWKNKTFGLTSGTYISSIAMTPDGTKVAIGSNGNPAGIYISTDSGTNFTKHLVGTHTTTNATWQGLGMSNDGTKMIAGDYTNGELFFSLDSGGTWTQVTSIPGANWRSTLVSADGTKYVVMGNTGKVYTGALG